MAGTNHGLPRQVVCAAASNINSLDKKPFNGGRPAIDKVASSVSTKVIGINRRKPPNARMSRLWAA